jgi:hypothetical protein
MTDRLDEDKLETLRTWGEGLEHGGTPGSPVSPVLADGGPRPQCQEPATRRVAPIGE